MAQECDESSEYVTVELKKIGFEGPDDLTESLEYISTLPAVTGDKFYETFSAPSAYFSDLFLLSIHRYFSVNSVNSALRTCAGTASGTAVWTPRTSQRSKFYYKSRIVRFKPDRFNLAG